MDENLRISRERVDCALKELMEYNSQDIGDLITDLYVERKVLGETLEYIVRLQKRKDLSDLEIAARIEEKATAILSKFGLTN